MEIKDFIKEGKLVIPEEEIDNIYIWTKVSRTYELLLSSKAYFALISKSFKEDSTRIVSILKDKLTELDENPYTLSDYITFNANIKSIFNKKGCFVYAKNDANNRMLNSLACYIAHTKNQYFPKSFILSEVLITRVDRPDIIDDMFNRDFVFLQVHGSLPDHKYKTSTLEGLFVYRCTGTHYTLANVADKKFLFDGNEHIENLAKSYGVKDISGLIGLMNKRRNADYKTLMPLWYGMMANYDNLVYSTDEPKVNKREIGRI